MKNEKTKWVLFSINIANFEAFCWTKKLTSHLFFLKSEVCSSVYELKVVFGLLNEAIIHLVPLSLGWCTCHVNCVTVAPGRVTWRNEELLTDHLKLEDLSRTSRSELRSIGQRLAPTQRRIRKLGSCCFSWNSLKM